MPDAKPRIGDQLRRANVANIVKKLNAGGTLSREERAALDDYEATKDGAGQSGGSIRWNLSHAADEFGSHRDTIRKALLAGGHQPDAEGCFSTRQIHQALSGDREMEKARLAKAQADRVELDNAERRRQLIPVEDAATLARRFTFAAVGKIRAVANLTDEEKNVVIGELRRLAECDFTELPDVET